MEIKKRKIFLISLMFFLLALPLISAVSASALNEASQCLSECREKVCVYYFYSLNCHACQIIKDFMNTIESKYQNNITLHKFNVNSPENFQIYSNFCSIQNLPMEKRGIPLVITKEDFLMGANNIKENLENSINKLISKNEIGCISEDICHNLNQNNSLETKNSQSIISIPLIITAAAADSINPCAIGVLIFLIGFLMLSSSKNKKRTLKIASIYIGVVYLTYFLAGIGILELLTKLTFLGIVNYIFGIGVLVLGIINIKDAIQNKIKGTLAIPTSAKPLIEKWVYKVSIPAAIILGIIVASLELPCTGGMYLAILTLMANTLTKNIALAYLALYNFIFVLPLIIITFAFINGFESEKLQNWFEKHKRKSRAIMGVMLIILGITLLLLA